MQDVQPVALTIQWHGQCCGCRLHNTHIYSVPLFSSDNLQKLIASTMRRWAQEDFISMQDLVREMFSLLHRQYNGIGELMVALEKTYVISVKNCEDITLLLKALGIIRSLLMVQAGHEEEELMKNSLK